ncbi:hypothetical protein SARC_13603 [Sphaeroforma arctica JP610]|uniref:Nucleotide-diphospho-sugar transferase domain-containing protein n=1 Tax=Sphaeroforma arctica JP610 TaxID=667725 RepID=A0A0L0FCP3_9EUKA|nr:hypothetical protein SARC_13603 [Sphaeroforma arctica JP610]KNC73838.1 hypothetical protein SARC_13603 [Sphaeroforma arctica JP610]|eukprot:XP_014147740.1 hypothetical protein SARC_13603 [Sphaeroforma arctica JP610]
MTKWNRPSLWTGIIPVLLMIVFLYFNLDIPERFTRGELDCPECAVRNEIGTPLEGIFDLSDTSNPITKELMFTAKYDTLPLIMTATSVPFYEMTLNWYISVKNAGVRNRVLFVCHDTIIIEKLRPHMRTDDILALYSLPFSAVPDSTYGSNDYGLVARARTKMVFDVVSREIPLWFTDVDMVWNRDPWPFIADLQSKGHDIAVLRDGNHLCAGFFAVINSTADGIIDFFGDWDKGMSGKNLNQGLFNTVAKQHSEISLGYLPANLFPDGRQYFHDFDADQRKEVVVVHNNFIKGYQNKVDRFKSHNLWII